MISEAKYFRLGEIAENLHKRVVELESKMTPNTPPEVLEERRKVVTEAMQNIEEEEVLCAKAIKQVSQSWEVLIDDTELEQVT